MTTPMNAAAGSTTESAAESESQAAGWVGGAGWAGAGVVIFGLRLDIFIHFPKIQLLAH